MALLEVSDLRIAYDGRDGTVQAVNGISLQLEAGGSLGIVGESGSGKSQTALAVMGLLAPNARVEGSIRFDGEELIGRSEPELAQLRGKSIAMVFQDPMTSLNPYLRIGRQMTEVLERHHGASRKDARNGALQMLDAVQIPDARNRIDAYPHELSGGMRQRVMIAMSLLCRPRLLLADEPTTALDVTVQAQILRLLAQLRQDFDLAIMLITHDLGLVAELCERTAVFYAGAMAEAADTAELLRGPRHPYTHGLLQARPGLDGPMDQPLLAMPGSPPEPGSILSGCPFAPRCPRAEAVCQQTPPWTRQGERGFACHLPIG
jgi:oligopeptide transport system ATP-binding protein